MSQYTWPRKLKLLYRLQFALDRLLERVKKRAYNEGQRWAANYSPYKIGDIVGDERTSFTIDRIMFNEFKDEITLYSKSDVHGLSGLTLWDITYLWGKPIERYMDEKLHTKEEIGEFRKLWDETQGHIDLI